MTVIDLHHDHKPLFVRGQGMRATCGTHWWARLGRDWSGWHIVSDPKPVKAVSR